MEQISMSEVCGMKRLLKRRYFGVFCLLGALIIISGIVYSCDELGISDPGLEEDYFASVAGELHIDGVPPKETDELLLALMTGLTPKFTKTIARRELDLAAARDTISFKMEAEVGEYDALFVIWKQLGTPLAVIENLVGASCVNDTLDGIVITPENRNVKNVQVDANLRKVNRTAGVTGVIRFLGEFPDDIENLGVVFAGLDILDGGISACNLLRLADIRFLPKTPVDSLRFTYQIAPGPTLMVVAFNRRGQSLFEPTIISNLFAGIFEAEAGTLQQVDLAAAFAGSVQ
jgi:hypothetical protein